MSALQEEIALNQIKAKSYFEHKNRLAKSKSIRQSIESLSCGFEDLGSYASVGSTPSSLQTSSKAAAMALSMS